MCTAGTHTKSNLACRKVWCLTSHYPTRLGKYLLFRDNAYDLQVYMTIYRCIRRFTGVYDAIHNCREGHEDRTACLSRENFILMSRLLWSLLRMLLDSQLWHLPSVPYVSPFNYYRVVLFLTDERKKKEKAENSEDAEKMTDGWRKEVEEAELLSLLC